MKQSKQEFQFWRTSLQHSTCKKMDFKTNNETPKLNLLFEMHVLQLFLSYMHWSSLNKSAQSVRNKQREWKKNVWEPDTNIDKLLTLFLFPQDLIGSHFFLSLFLLLMLHKKYFLFLPRWRNWRKKNIHHGVKSTLKD